MVMGEEAPHDRKQASLALDLIHAARTGQFPYAGGLADQPMRIRSLYYRVLVIILVAESAAMRMGAMGLGGIANGDNATGHRDHAGRRSSSRSRRIVGPGGPE